MLALTRQVLRIIAGIRIGFGIGYSAAIAWVDRLRKTGSLEPSQIGGYKQGAVAGSAFCS